MCRKRDWRDVVEVPQGFLDMFCWFKGSSNVAFGVTNLMPHLKIRVEQIKLLDQIKQRQRVSCRKFESRVGKTWLSIFVSSSSCAFFRPKRWPDCGVWTDSFRLISTVPWRRQIYCNLEVYMHAHTRTHSYRQSFEVCLSFNLKHWSWKSRARKQTGFGPEWWMRLHHAAYWCICLKPLAGAFWDTADLY